ncbi:MAG TPA: capsular biosynthesis protein [Cyanobacteria bacterium UBA11049]|nr:capsular biosynthesis protein [Cyanobacteria bacterium UBA11049]
MARVNEHNLPINTETDGGYGQLFSVLMRRRFWLLGVLGSVLTIATVFTLISKPTYQSTMQLLIEPNYQGKRDTDAQRPSQQYAESGVKIDDYATQINVMRSSLLLQRAADILRPEYPTITAKEIKANLKLRQVLEEKVNTKIVEATYTANDPVKAEKVLEAVYKVYQIYNREQQQQRLQKGLKFINEQIPVVSKTVDQAENKLEQFRKNYNLIDPEQQATAVSQSLNAIAQERQVIRAQYKDLQARYNALQQQLARSPQQALAASRLSQSSRYQTLLNELQKTELALSQRRVTFTDEDPQVKKLLEQRQNTIEMLKSEGGRVVGKEQAQSGSTGENILTQGQLGGIDLNLTNQLVDVQTNLNALRARDVSLEQTQKQLRTDLNRFPVLLAEYNRLQPLLQINRNKLQQLLQAQQELSLEIARGGFDWQALEEPKQGQQIGPNLKLNLLLGLVAGLMLGGVAAFLREAVDDSVHTSEELEKQVELPLLGMTPELPKNKLAKPQISLPFGKPHLLAPWTVQVSNWPPTWESLDLIYKNIQLMNELASFKSLMVTSAVAGEGKSTLALGLALSAARLHQRVLLIDADLRRPNLHEMLSLPNEQGLSTLLSSDATLPGQGVIQSSGAFIDILTAGPLPSDPANLLSSQRMRELIAEFEKNYDLILLDAPPVLGMVDAMIAASLCTGVVLVSRVGQVTKTELTQARAMLNKLNVIGVVANGVNGVNHGYAAAYTRENGAVLNKVWGN